MTRKSRRRSKSRSADLEAQPGGEGVLCDLPYSTVTVLTLRYKEVNRGEEAYELDTHISRRDGEASEAIGSYLPVLEMDRGVHARSSTQLQVGGPNDCPSNSGGSGEYCTLS
jgi:hypothetical protein